MTDFVFSITGYKSDLTFNHMLYTPGSKNMDYVNKITRPDIDDNALYGFIVKSSSLFTLIVKEYDFAFWIPVSNQ